MVLGMLFQVVIVLYNGDVLNFAVLCAGMSFPEVNVLVLVLGL